MRIFTALGLTAVLAFSLFGLLATFEYAELSRRLPWQAGYGALGLICIVNLVICFRREPPKSNERQPPK